MFDQESVQGAIDHMNGHHADANVLYVRAWGGIDDVQTALITSINSETLTLQAIDEKGASHTVDIAFSPALNSANELHRKLISMVKNAREVLGIPPKHKTKHSV